MKYEICEASEWKYSTHDYLTFLILLGYLIPIASGGYFSFDQSKIYRIKVLFFWFLVIIVVAVADAIFFFFY